jgi:hypothetical protein
MDIKHIKDWLAPHAKSSLPSVAQTVNTGLTPPDSAIAAPNLAQSTQVLLSLHYQEMMRNGRPMPKFGDVQFRAYSQNGEDGLLLYVFSVIGTTNKLCMEVCAGEGIQCNTANLIINHGWRGLLLDGDAEKLEKGRVFYRSNRDTFMCIPKLFQAWITPQNINDIIRFNNFTGEIDLLSLDLDGNDYWIWKAIDVAQPRVVILEYQNAWGPGRRVTQRYVEDFRVENVVLPGGLPRCGASLEAFAALAREKGYRLVGCERSCINAIFIKNSIGEDYFPEIPVCDCFDHPQVAWRHMLMREQEHLLPDMWQEV